MNATRAKLIITATDRWRTDGNPMAFMLPGEIENVERFRSSLKSQGVEVSLYDALKALAQGGRPVIRFLS